MTKEHLKPEARLIVERMEAALLKSMKDSYGDGHEPIQKGSPLLEAMAFATFDVALEYKDYIW